MNEQNQGFTSRSIGGRKGEWRFEFEKDVLRLTAVEGTDSFEIARDDIPEKIEIRETTFMGLLAWITLEKKKTTFKLEPEKFNMLRKWVGPPTHRTLKVVLKNRLKWSIPIGIVFMLGSMPLEAVPEEGIEAVPMDAVGMFLGMLLIVIAVCSRLWPRRMWLLIEGVWMVILSLDVLYTMVTEEKWLWIIFMMVMGSGASQAFREYARFSVLDKKDDWWQRKETGEK